MEQNLGEGSSSKWKAPDGNLVTCTCPFSQRIWICDATPSSEDQNLGHAAPRLMVFVVRPYGENRACLGLAGRISFFVWVILNYSALLWIQVIGCNANLMLRSYQSQAGLGLLVWMGKSKLGFTAVHKVGVVHLLYFMLTYSVFCFL